MKWKIIETFVLPFVTGLIEELLSEDNVQVTGDKLFDLFEELVAKSETTIDDAIVLPIIAQMRKALNIPDLPDE